MDANDNIRFLTGLRYPPLRHLAWLCSAPQLLSVPESFRPSDCLDPEYRQRLQAWDTSAPQHLPAALVPPFPRRLGFYTERLYAVLLQELLGWPVLLHNQPVRAGGQTLGELDFVVHNRQNQHIEHHEIAIKFYLGMTGPDGRSHWYGPDAADRFDTKVSRLCRHQARLTHHPETLAILATRGITGPLPGRLFMPGYLFYPGPQAEPAAPPSWVPEDHCRGYWYYHSDIRRQELGHCVPLFKPHWIGPWCQPQPPDPAAAREALVQAGERGVPVLLARLQWQSSRCLWVEQERFFVVPDQWPRPAAGPVPH